MAKKVEEIKTTTSEIVEVLKEIEVIKEVIINKAETSLDIYNKIENDLAFKTFINDFFKHYVNLGFSELNVLLNTNNCIQYVSSDLNQILLTYLQGYLSLTKFYHKNSIFDKSKQLTNYLRQIYPFTQVIKQNITPVFETTNKKYFAGASYKLYSIEKEIA